MEKLPKSIVELIFSNLDITEICKYSSVCKKWNRGEYILKKLKNNKKKKKLKKKIYIFSHSFLS